MKNGVVYFMQGQKCKFLYFFAWFLANTGCFAWDLLEKWLFSINVWCSRKFMKVVCSFFLANNSSLIQDEKNTYFRICAHLISVISICFLYLTSLTLTSIWRILSLSSALRLLLWLSRLSRSLLASACCFVTSDRRSFSRPYSGNTCQGR